MIKQELRVIIEEAVDVLITRVKAHKKLNNVGEYSGHAYTTMVEYLHDDFSHGGFIFGDFYSSIYKGCSLVFFRSYYEIMFEIFYSNISNLDIDKIINSV